MKQKTMKVGDVMTTETHMCQVGDSLERAAQLLWENDCGCLPVVDSGGVVRSMITDRDICMAAYTSGQPLSALKVADSMASSLTLCHPEDDVETACEQMAAHQVRRMPVVDKAGAVQGVLSLSDLARAADKAAAKSLKDPAAVASFQVLRAVSRPRSHKSTIVPAKSRELPKSKAQAAPKKSAAIPAKGKQRSAKK